MPNKHYTIKDTDSQSMVSEPAVAYRTKSAATSANSWNPNVPFCGTQEEWWEHFHRIEKGEFMSLDEFNQKFETWWKIHIAKKLR